MSTDYNHSDPTEMALSSNTVPLRPVPSSRNSSEQDMGNQITKKYIAALPTSDRIDRTSFSSIKESNSGVAQSFTDSKVSSYLRHEFDLNGSEEAISDDGSSSGIATPAEKIVPKIEELPQMLPPHSHVHDFICPCVGFRGWKSISIGGKVASRSSGDLRKLAMGYDWYSKDTSKVDRMDLDVPTPQVKQDGGCYLAGQSPFEKLPTELLGKLRSLILKLRGNISGLVTRNVTTGLIR